MFRSLLRPGTRPVHFAQTIFFVLGLGIVPITCVTSTAFSAEITIRDASTVLTDNVYRLNADINYQFSDVALEALQRGVPLVVELNINIERERAYMWNETTASLLQRYQLRYVALTKRYVIANLNSGAETQYPSRVMAINELGEIIDLPILDSGLINSDDDYSINLRASFDIESLPVPMRVTAYFSSDWRIKSEWRTWPLR